MNLIDSFEMERISQAVEDLRSLMITDVEIPELVEYQEGRMDLQASPSFRPFQPMDRWGGYDRYGWFRCTFQVPGHMAGKQLWVELSQDKREWYAQNPQFLLYCNGKPVQGMDLFHETCMLRTHAREGEILQLDFDAWAGMVTRGRSWSDKENRPGLFSLRFYCVDTRVQEVFYDLLTPYEVAKYAGQEGEAGLKIMEAVSQAVNRIDFRDPGSTCFYDSLSRAREILKNAFYQHEEKNAVTAASVGHTHIDVAWMWQFSHTKMKTQRSFSTALKLLEEYPEFVFMASQPQLYEYMKEEQPEQFDRIREYVKQGRWEPEGGMWVEADCNLTSGESLIRQFLVGKKYFRETFNTDSRVLWLPDVFGYSAALPQICKKCGIDYFMTTKISWNEKNKIPYDTFLWKGIDGSELLTHFSPVKQYDTTDYNPFGFARSPHITTYNGVLEPDYVMGGWKRYSQKKLNPFFLMPYGYGDGGGGPTRDMIEKGRRMSAGLPGCPKVEFTSVKRFFHDLETWVAGKKQLPVWAGELYLEFHRGTYTSVGIAKRLNRKAENMLQRTEFLMCAAHSCDQNFNWDKGQWNQMVKKLLTNQFHDILPGSALSAVYDDVRKIYGEIFQVMEHNKEKALDILRQSIPEGFLGIINTLGFERGGTVEFPYGSEKKHLLLKDREGREYPAQHVGDGRYIAFIPKALGGGISVWKVQETGMDLPWEWDGRTIENDSLRVSFAEDGTLSSIYDKEAMREVLSGPGNVLETYEDRPYQYDAWEISPYYRKKAYGGGTLLSMEIVENGSVRACIRQKRSYLSSVIWQDIYLYRHSRRIDFHTRIDWKEQHILLKAAFPVDFVADKAVYEIQFGTVERPAHTNTSWDAERFETCAQRFADLAEPDYGAALLNDCKYGYDIHDGVMRLTLLRSPVFPNREDTCFHEFTYSFMPHMGTYREAEVQKEAYDLNNPLFAAWGTRKGSAWPESLDEGAFESLAVCNSPGIFTETIKPAEDGDGYVFRVYEGYGCRRQAEFSVKPSCQTYECDMLEKEQKAVQTEDGRFFAEFRPFEIKTYKLKMQKY